MPDASVFDAILDDRGVIVLSGEIDVACVPHLRRELQLALERTVGKVVIDLSGVRFLDAAGIGAMVEAARLASEQGRNLVVTRPSAMVRRLIDILGPNWPLETI